MYSQLYQWQMEYIIFYQKTVPNFSICQISTGTQILDPLSWFTSQGLTWWIYSAQSTICHYLMLQFVKNLGADSWIYFPISTLEARKGFSGAEEMAQLGKCLRCKLTDLNLIQKSHKKVECWQGMISNPRTGDAKTQDPWFGQAAKNHHAPIDQPLPNNTTLGTMPFTHSLAGHHALNAKNLTDSVWYLLVKIID